jgi:hypothetical protein
MRQPPTQVELQLDELRHLFRLFWHGICKLKYNKFFNYYTYFVLLPAKEYLGSGLLIGLELVYLSNHK